MSALFSEYPEATANTVCIAERCVADVPVVDPIDLPEHLPDFDIPAGFDNANAYIRHLVLEGLARRYAKETSEEIQRRSDYELNIIINMGFTGYFLIVADFVNWAREHGIPVGPGRGSGAGSIVAYALHITDIDPIKYDLLFERFINPERISMPDFDIDFGNEGRDKVIEYVTEKYGKDRVAQIITFGTLGARTVIMDVARVLDISMDETEKVTRPLPYTISLKEAIEAEPKLRDMEADPKYAELFTIARKLEGLKRHFSLHAAGYVIGKTALHDFVPLYGHASGNVAVQCEFNYLEKFGLVKFDFLGLKTLDLIKYTGELIRRRRGANFSIDDIPEDDRATFTLFSEGNTDGVFLFESDGMKGILKQAKPQTIHDLIALNALYRPGPMQYIPQFIDSKNGKQNIAYPDPCLEDILKETYGVIVYQEQLMRIIQRIAGYSLGNADILRRILGKKKIDDIEKEKETFVAHAITNGFKEDQAANLFDSMIPFAAYVFSKSHSAGYMKLSYQTAYLKANFPAEFMAAKSYAIHSANKLGT